MVDKALIGMQIEAVRHFARTLDDRAEEVESVAAKTSSRINSINWRGNDRDRFVNEWREVHEPKLRWAAAEMRSAAKAARRSAADQERISR